MPPVTNPGVPSRADWAGPDGAIGTYIANESKKTLAAYCNQPNMVAENANQEEDTARGGYAHRQLFELVQNGADALSGSRGGRIWISLNSTHLYCADEGKAIDPGGVKALMFSHLSPKRGTAEIGRFGLGFKSVLGVTDTPEFFSRSGSFRFDRERAARLVHPIAPDVERYPVLRLPEAIDPWPEMEEDGVLRDLMCWAVNIVRLPLKADSHDDLEKQIEEFPAEFLLFVEHVEQLVLLTDQQEANRVIALSNNDGYWVLDDSGVRSRWMLRKDTHRLSPDARRDRRALDDAEEVLITWGAPVDRLNDPGKFWTFFPTMTTSLLSGILNAPWKTNEDRQNLLPGVYNDELIDAAAVMVANTLPSLSTPEDPARHLDVLPRRREAGDSEHSDRLRDQLHTNLRDQSIAPDQNGELRTLLELSFPPQPPFRSQEMNPEALERWAAHEERPSNWLHHSALTRNRLATLDRLYDTAQYTSMPRATVAEWLEALVEDAKTADPPGTHQIDASAAAIQTAALIAKTIRDEFRIYPDSLGNIVLNAVGEWVEPEPNKVFLGGGHVSGAGYLVHPGLEADPETLRALKELGLKPASAETTFRDYAQDTFAGQLWANWKGFWRRSRDLDHVVAADIIKSSGDHWRDSLKIRTVDGQWLTLFESLLPGPIVPGDGSRDGDVAIDIQFHEADLPLMRRLGAAETPRGGHELSRTIMKGFTDAKRKEFTKQELPSNPQLGMLNFGIITTSGPLDVLGLLSDEGKALYTWDLLDIASTYEQWTMRHDTRRDFYPPMNFKSPALEAVREHGRIKTDGGVFPLSEGFGKPPQNTSVWERLLAHTRADQIREAFDLADPPEIPPEPIGEDSPVPLVDEWPGVGPHLSRAQNDLQLIRCDGFRMFSDGVNEDEPDCIVRDGFVYLARQDDEEYEIRAVLKGLGCGSTMSNSD